MSDHLSPDPILHVLAGPNGAGKTTFVEHRLAPLTGLPFVNADVIAATRWPDRAEAAAHALDASALAATERERLLAGRASFITETVFSHPSKVDLVESATRLGYRVYLHVILLPEDAAVARVQSRLTHGGHLVPEEKIRERWHRLWPLVADARNTAGVTQFYDNSRMESAFRVVATYRRGVATRAPQWPRWTPTALL